MRSSVVVLGFLTSLGGVGALGGCGFSSPACETFASQVDTCALVFTDDLTLSGTITYDTSTHELRVDGATMPVAYMTLTAQAGDVDAIFASNVRLSASAQLRATGTRPLAIVASGSVTLAEGASIDVGNGGAGALPSCTTPPMPGGDSVDGAGGGGGGGYGAAGGNGGDGNKNGTRSTGGSGGASIEMPAGLVGGCPGARGGVGASPGGSAGSGGLGGGALYIVAANRIDLGNMAFLTAGGGGGHSGGQRNGIPATGNAGGGGGGTGGMIFLEASHIGGLQARVAANGGGGGEGSEDVQGGNDGSPGTTSTTRAPGGAGGTMKGADGGLGGSLEVAAGETATMFLDGGGGGGGGGVGFVHIVSRDQQLGLVSPAAQ